MKKIVAINASPRPGWNTAALVSRAADGAQAEGAEIRYFDLYRIGPFTGCVSCFGCKLQKNLGRCVHKDCLYPVLEEIRSSDGLILGTPNYLGDISSGLRALYERLIFQYITYKTEPRSCSTRKIPVLLIMTSNCAEEFYPNIGYDKMLEGYKATLTNMIGPAKILICSDTLQVTNYDKYNWTMFDPQAKRARNKEVFPKDLQKAFGLGADMVKSPWE